MRAPAARLCGCQWECPARPLCRWYDAARGRAPDGVRFAVGPGHCAFRSPVPGYFSVTMAARLRAGGDRPSLARRAPRARRLDGTAPYSRAPDASTDCNAASIAAAASLPNLCRAVVSAGRSPTSPVSSGAHTGSPATSHTASSDQDQLSSDNLPSSWRQHRRSSRASPSGSSDCRPSSRLHRGPCC
jgi:hypothetical protein